MITRSLKTNKDSNDDFVNGVDHKSIFLINSATAKTREATRQISSTGSILENILRDKGVEID